MARARARRPKAVAEGRDPRRKGVRPWRPRRSGQPVGSHVPLLPKLLLPQLGSTAAAEALDLEWCPAVGEYCIAQVGHRG